MHFHYLFACIKNRYNAVDLIPNTGIFVGLNRENNFLSCNGLIIILKLMIVNVGII